jgi:hypothetical protein
VSFDTSRIGWVYYNCKALVKAAMMELMFVFYCYFRDRWCEPSKRDSGRKVVVEVFLCSSRKSLKYLYFAKYVNTVEDSNLNPWPNLFT